MPSADKFGEFKNWISWSKVGLIAYVTDSGSNVQITYIQCTDGQQWALSKPQLLKDLRVVHNATPITYLHWSPYGVELAIIDIKGGMSVFMHNGILNYLSCMYKSIPANPTVGDEIIGFQWLNMRKAVLTSNPAVRQENAQFHYGMHKLNPFGPCHPQGTSTSSNKQACIGVTRNGKVRLWYQQDQTYMETVVDLESELYPEDYYTLAALGADRDNTLVLATYSAARHCLKLFRVSVQWSFRQNPAMMSNQQPVPDNDVASIQIRRLFSNEVFSPNHNQRVLSHLEVVSPTDHPESRLVILAGFASDEGTTIQKIEVVVLPLTLHSNFLALGLQRNAIAEDPTDVVQFQDYFDINKKLVSMKSLYLDSVVFCAYSDGSVDIRRRSDFAEYTPVFETQTVTNLFDAGFGFPNTEPALDMCISPNLVATVLLNADNELKLYHMTQMLDLQDGEASTIAAVALAIRHTIACYNNICCDDLMLITGIQSLAQDPEFSVTYLRQCHKGINFSLDLPKDVQADKFLLLLSLHKLLSLQAALGTQHGWKRTVPGNIAWTTLNLRLFAFALIFTLKATSQKQAGQAENEVKGDTLMTLLGLSKWCVDFLVYLLQDIFELSRDPDKFLQPNSTSIALVMLLGAVPRLLIRYTLRGLRGLEQIVSRSANRDTDAFGVSQMAFKQLEEIFKSVPIQIASFEKLVSDVEKFMRTMYQADPADRLNTEQTIFLKAQIPSELHGAVHKIRSVFIDEIKSETDIPALYFYPTAWLGLSGQVDIDGIAFDGLRKQIMPHPTTDGKVERSWKRCVRCGSITTLDEVNKSQLKYPSHWTVAFQRNCLCGNAWVRCSSKG
ncbi:mediator complex, subunit Med16 [Lipomyces arxii]|uniref:mediator complex, subunit Med16 n=1 Tax=Lipomyces arxii TaxID=56418 RepID=UPI0034CFA272